MVQLHRFVPIIAVLTLLTTPVKAQTPVPTLQDLAGARGSSAEGEMKSRGYQLLRTDKSDAGVYMYWKETRSGKCVTVQVEGGRYQSIVYAPAFDCQTAQSTPKPSHPSAGTPVANLKDLVGARAGQAENTIKQRGYQFLKSSPEGNSIYSYWRETKTSHCVTIRTEQGRYQSIVYASPLDCQ